MPAIIFVVAVLLFSAGLAISPTADERAVNDEEVEEVEEPVTEDPEPSSAEEEDEIAEEEPPEPAEEGDVEEEVEPAGELEAHFIEVGQGDAIYLDAPQKNILIDGGDRDDIAANYLAREGVESLDYVIATHPHADHIGGLISVMEQIEVEEVLDPGLPHTTVTFEDYIDTIEAHDIKFTETHAGMEKDLGDDTTMEVIHPESPGEEHLNNASIVTRVEHGEVSFMLTGDAEQEAEQEILNRDYELESDILKVGHHGSNTSTTRPFLEAVDPDIGVIMCGDDNPYGHPHDETIERLAAEGVATYRTDIQGTIVVTTDGEDYEVNQEPWN